MFPLSESLYILVGGIAKIPVPYQGTQLCKLSISCSCLANIAKVFFLLFAICHWPVIFVKMKGIFPKGHHSTLNRFQLWSILLVLLDLRTGHHTWSPGDIPLKDYTMAAGIAFSPWRGQIVRHVHSRLEVSDKTIDDGKDTVL